MSNPQSQIRPFGTTASGIPVSEIILDNGVLSCSLLTYGATLRNLLVPDKNCIPVDVVLGYDTLREYEENDGYLGATVGRYANRIGGSAFMLNGKLIRLSNNEGENQLHGGHIGFSHRVWDVEEVTAGKAVLSIRSPNGEEGYPGNLTARVLFSLEESALRIRYSAVSDMDTVCSLTNHSYFNLAGHASGTMLQHKLVLSASSYTPVDDSSIPTGEILSAEGTPMDLRTPVAVGDRVNDPFPQIRRAKGIDHNFVIDGEPAARVWSEASGISMTVSTTMPGIQLYTGNFLAEGRRGKDGCAYGPYHGFCLETQHFPDAPNCPQFPSPVLKAGEIYNHTTEFTFSIQAD